MRKLRGSFACGLALVMMMAMAVVVAPGARAYGIENWQIGFAGTGVAPTTGFGFGFWGWCTFGGGVASGATGNCQISTYGHSSSGSLTCEVDLDVTAWTISASTMVPLPTFHASGTAQVNPASATVPCLAGSGFTNPFSNADTGIPGVAGHFNVGTFGTLKGEFVIQVTQLSP